MTLPTNIQTVGGFGGIGMPPLKSLAAVTATGAGQAFALGSACKDFGVQVTVTGAPTISVTLQGSIDGVTWATLGSAIVSATYTAILGNPVNYVRLNLGTLTGGTVPTVTGWITGL